MITATIKPNNNVMMLCPSHRMRQISFETVWPTKYEYGQPLHDVYTFYCKCCNQKETLIINHEKEVIK